MPATRWLVLIETFGNQAYIFSSNKLREQVGASELVWRSTFEWARSHAADLKLEEVSVSSGKGIFLSTTTRADADELIKRTTLQALDEAPGLDIMGVVVEVPEESDPSSEPNGPLPIERAISRAYREMEAAKAFSNGPEARFEQFPIGAYCSTSRFPAAAAEKLPGEGKLAPFSRVSLAKRERRNDAYTRIRESLCEGRDEIKMPENIDDLAEAFDKLDWLGVIHADGNGLGQIFMNFGEYCGARQAPAEMAEKAFIDGMKEFSAAIDKAMADAFREALKNVGFAYEKAENKRGVNTQLIFPVIPLILGGDDLTMLCDGKWALAFVSELASQFGALCEKNECINELLKRANAGGSAGATNLSLAAGVCLVKKNFPFSEAYALAEELTQEAKQAKSESPGSSSLAFHVLYDSSASSLEEIRERMTVDGGATRLYGGPYVLGEGKGGNAWAAGHSWPKLEALAKSLRAKHADDPLRGEVSSKQAHQIREAMRKGSAAGEAYYQLVERRLPDAFKKALTEGGGIFVDDAVGTEKARFTRLLDAMELAEFEPGLFAEADEKVGI